MTGSEAPAFRFMHEIDVRFRDLDPMGHAHHTLPLIYYEEARAAYWRMMTGSAELHAIDYVMGSVQVKYQGRIRWPQKLRVYVAVTRLGGASFDMAFEIRSLPDDELLSTGGSSQVMYDYGANRSKPIPQSIRHAITDFEPGLSI